MRGSTFFVCVSLLLSAVIVTSQGVTVTYINPHYGGENGATKISVFGTNFDTNLDLGSTTPTKEVFFVSALNEYTCEVHEAESDERQTVCYTGIMAIGTYYVRMKMNGIWLDRSMYCEGGHVSWDCQFHVVNWRTPLLSSLSWVTNEPKQFISVSGRLFTNLVSSNEAAADNGVTATITRVWLTSGACSLYGDDQEPYGITLHTEDGVGNWGTLQCLVKSSYVGNQNISFIVDQDYGRSWPYSSVKRVSADNRIYMVQTYAVVTDVSPKEGSVGGGTLLTISGKYFDNLSGIEAKVLVGGEECAIQSVTDTEITCLTASQPAARTAYSGGRGMAVKVFNGVTSFTEVLDDFSAGGPHFRDHTYPNFGSWSSNYLTKSEGFFIPSVDGNHKFTIQADEQFQFWFNSAGPDKDAAVLAATSSTADAEVRTEFFTLTTGTEYYFRVLHIVETTSTQYFKVGVYVDTTNYTPNHTESAKTEHQKFAIHSTVERETQKISFQDWAIQTAVESVWDAGMTCSDSTGGCVGVTFYFTLFGVSTDPIVFDGATDASVQLALNNLISLSGDLVEVTGDSSAGFQITFKSDRGSFPLEAVSSDESKLTITMTETTAGSPKLDTFTFKVNGQVSVPVQYDASAAEVASAVLSLFGPTCPEKIQRGIGWAIVYHDMETAAYLPISGTRTAEKSFCGSYSTKNVGYIYLNDEAPYSLRSYRHVCFAYTGDIADYLRISYEYNEYLDSGTVTHRESLRYIGISGLSDSMDGWTHFCYNLYDHLILDHPDAADFQIFGLYVSGGSDSSTDLYVDNIFLGTTPYSSSELEAAAQRVVPSAVTHIRLESVDVTKDSADEYEVIFNPIECGHDFPLLGFAFEASATPTRWSFADGTPQIQVERQTSASPPVEGTFGISFASSSFRPLVELAANVSEEELKNQLETLAQVTNVDVIRSETCYGYTWDVYFKSPGGDYPAMVGDASSLTSSPGSASISVTVETEGGLVMNPIYGDFIRTAHSTPQVQVFINNVPSHCEGGFDNDAATSCGYEWNDEATPKVTGISPTSGSPGTTITITGTGFSATNEDNVVKFEGVACSVTSCSDTSIECTIGNSPAGANHLSINVVGKGFATIDPSVSSFQVTGQVTSIAPASGSIYGCTTVTIVGSGFDGTSTVTIDSNTCTVETSSFDSITCVTSAGTAGTFDVDVTTGGVTTSLTSGFEYSSSGAGTITSVSPTTSPVSGGETLTITGSGFGTAEGAVYFSADDAKHSSEVLTWTDAEITIRTPSLAHGSYEVSAFVDGVGCSSSGAVSYSFTVTGITPSSGSLVGGTPVTITGAGFTSGTAVTFGDVSCNDITVNGDGTSLNCVTSSASTTHTITNSGQHPTFGIGYAWSPSTLDVIAGDHVTWAWSIPDQVTSSASIGLFTTSNSSSKEYDNNGFHVEKDTSGKHTFAINTVGTYYYASGCVDSDEVCDLFFRGTVNCEAASSVTRELSVRIGEHEANYAGSYSFTFDATITPAVSAVSPRDGTTRDNIVITGTGFSGTPTVTVGGKQCDVSTSAATSITCQVVPTAGLPVGFYHEVVVNVEGKGNARNEIRNVVDRTFLLGPLIDSISPSTGSVAGGTNITIEGSGFCASEATDCLPLVKIGDLNDCDVVTHDYNTITCATKSSSEATEEVQITIGISSSTCSSDCGYSYATASTPSVTSWTNNGDQSNLQVTFTGSGFGTTVEDVKVMFTSGEITKPCDVSSVTETEVVCSIMRFAVGDNEVSLSVEGKGLAKFDFSATINSPAVADSVSPSSGSINGGAMVTISGNGFVEGDATVAIGGIACEVVSVDLSTITCITAAHDAATAQLIVTSNGVTYDAVDFEFSSAATPTVTAIAPTEGSQGDVVTITGTGFGTAPDDVIATIGDVPCTLSAATDTQITCALGAREGGSARIEVLVEIKGLATVSASFTYSLSVDSISPTGGSYGGGQDVTISGVGFSENSRVTVCGFSCSITSNTGTEIRCMTPANENLSQGSIDCDVVVANGDDTATLTSSYTYQASLTPTITSVEPARGGTGGGTEITITGTGFGSYPQVSIDGITCVISSSSDTSITCTTNSHQGSIKTKVRVEVGTNGIAQQDNADFYYIDRWSSVFTWGGISLPTTQDFVIIQKGQTVLLDTDTAVLTMLLIDGGELIFDEADVQLNAENILIVNGGLLQVGTEDAPFQHKAVIQMYGQLRSPELPIYGAKTLGVRKGTLDLHGRHVMHTWTKLAATVEAGATEITLQHSVSDWQVGDRIIIATTGLRHSQSENEERPITAISPDGLTLTLAEPLEHQHLGITGSIEGKDIEFRAEVGLLTRNVVFRGTNDLAWSDTVPACEDGFETGQFSTQTCFQGRFGEETGSDEFGASIMMHSQEPSSGDVMARIENIEVTYAGQAFRLGRYPIHWHLMGDVSGMYVKSCSIHRTFNRAVTIHGTHNLLVENNVVYNIMGGAIFIEDGIETGNIIQYNLAVFVRQSTSLLNDDITPAAYWVTNPNNTLRHNHAAGGTHFGFWYRMHEHPDGPSFDPNICQQQVELGIFENNTVHSQGWFGLWIFQHYFPMAGSSCDSTVPSPAKFRTLTTWNSEKGAEWVDCGAIQFIDFVMVNNEDCGMDLKLIKGTKWGEEEGALIKDSLIVGRTNELEVAATSPTGIVLPFSPGLYVKGVSFVNFDQGGVAFAVTSIQGTCVFVCGGYYYWLEDLTFTDVAKKIHWRWPHEGVLLDRDGSFSGGDAMRTIVPFTGLMDTSVCTVQSGDMYSSNADVPSAICNAGTRFHRIALNQPVPSSLEGNNLWFSNEHGNSSSTYQKKRLTHKEGYMLLLPSKKSYRMWFEDGEQFTNITYNSRYYDFLENDYIFVSHVFKQRPDAIKINEIERYQIINSTVLTPDSNNLDWYFNQENLEFQFIVSGATSSSRRKRATIEVVDDRYKHVTVSPTIYRCLYAGCIPPASPDDIPPSRERPDEFQRWSQGGPCMEWHGENNNSVVIKQTAGDVECWVVVDVNSVEVDNITVQGVLQFEASCYVSAIHILVQRGRIIAGFTDEDYFAHDLTINLRGDHDTPGWILPGVDLGSKAIGCFGGCDFHGKPHNVYWTHLAATANAGSTVITLVKEVDWEVGDEIVVTTTGYRSDETEKHVITAISGDGRTITLSQPLEYRHMGEDYTVGGWQYSMRAEVGLLTRNIKIVGESYSNIDTQAFGARVLVGLLQVPGEEDGVGWARFSSVEFHQTGQEGWTEEWDPRFSLAWLNTGRSTTGRPSYVTGCAFHDGYSTAIGTFGADNVNITDNIVHRAVHDGIRLSGSNHRLERNLVTVALFRGTYGDRFEETNFKDWHASFELTEARNLIMNDNTAAGSERLGFHFDGEPCDATEEDAWTGNVAHGCLHGLHIFIEDGNGGCSMIRNFVVYKSWDFGIYHQTQDSVIINNTIVVDSTVGYLPLIFAPPALSHQYLDKPAIVENMLCVGRSPHFDPSQDFMDENNDDNLKVRAFGPSKKAPSTPTGGKTCVMLPLFQSASNAAPFKPFHRNLNYPTVHGLLSITGLHAHSYKINDGKRDLVFFTNPDNEDGYHPTLLQGTRLSDVEDESKVVFERPSLGLVNPSDCVDMECDGRKKCLIKDLDGGFLGSRGAVVPQAEFGWDDPNEISRGLGDYRIPKTMLTATDGTRIPVADIADGKGIIRSSACEYKSSWLAYDCHGEDALDYQMLVIESMDDDTETRRLSPVALLGGRYIDLNNGPQDHGWCAGYTCQKRISTFYTIVASGHHFDIFFTGYAPQNLRLHLLNVDDSVTMRVAIWYAKPERLDVLRAESGLYIHPQNSVYDAENEYWTLQAPDQANEGAFKPAIDSPIHGANYMDRRTNLLYVTLRGREPIDIVTVPAVVIKFGFPATTVDDFFGENLISNLADFLSVPSYKIRVVDIVRETSSRRKRDTSGETVTYTIMYSDPILNETAYDNSTAKNITVWNDGATQIVVAYQTGALSSAMGTNVTSLGVSEAADNNANANSTEVVYTVPTAIRISSLPSTAEEYMTFAEQPVITLLDSQGEVVNLLDDIFEVTVSLDKSGSGADVNAQLTGTTSMMFTNGEARFTDLMITHSGSYNLQFQISQPADTSVSAATSAISVSMRSVSAAYMGATGDFVQHGSDVSISLLLLDSNGQTLQNVGYKGHTWRADVSLDHPTMYAPAALAPSATTTFTFDPSTATATTSNLQLANTQSFYKYNLVFRVYTEPALYEFTLDALPIPFYGAGESTDFPTNELDKIRIEVKGRPYLQRTLTSEPMLRALMNNFAVNAISNTTARVSNMATQEADNGNTYVDFDLSADSSNELEAAKEDLKVTLESESSTLENHGVRIASASCVFVVNNDLCYGVSAATPASDQVTGGLETWVYVVIGVIAAILLAAVFITTSCLLKRAQSNKVGTGGGCLDASSSRGSSPLVDSFYASSSGFTPNGATPSGGHYPPRTGMTPVQT